ncbi:ATP-dependent translocase ABCB1-like [Pseudophryne corroboree]|uniref:ATP-dependent translocase ABCB1-like n=1 Tax=Pseudophryne corroboree TaxID=495146 RepID=UPI0030821C7D
MYKQANTNNEGAWGSASYIAGANTLSDMNDISFINERDRSYRSVFFYNFIAVGSLVFALSLLQIWTFLISATRQIRRIRQKFFSSVLHQDMSYFDSIQIETLHYRLTEDIFTLHEGLGDKLCIFVNVLSTFVSCQISAFVNGWKLTLVILSVSPLFGISTAVWSKIIASFSSKESLAYEKAGAFAEEIVTAIKTVTAFNGQQKAVDNYDAKLIDARNVGIKKSITLNLSCGAMQFIGFAIYSLSFWYGTKIIEEEPENYSISNVFIIIYSVMLGTYSLGLVTPNLESIRSARTAAFELYKIINKFRPIDSGSTEGHKPDKLIGHIEFKNIHFAYPTRPDIQILSGLNLKVPSGKTIALVGTSGCGKSTTIQLLQRFYDPIEGEITVDGHDIRSLNVKWLRNNIGVVSQEPVLFGTTIGENIRYGRDGVTEEEIEHAAREANAYEFISKFPDQFNTMVGERGAQMSGGQKQRIAIARALVRNPKILLLDEATSALDKQSEAIVQAALDTARAGRTTIMIAHRLSTVRTADVIAIFHGGVIVEQGSHDELMSKEGIYHSLVMLQTEDRNGREEDESKSSSNGTTDSKEESEEDRSQYIEEASRTLQDVENRMVSVRHQSLLEESKRKVKKTKSTTKSSKKQSKIIKEEMEVHPEVPMRRIMQLNKPEWPYIVIGAIASGINGVIFSIFGAIFGMFIGAFGEQDYVKRSQRTNFLSIMLLIMGLIGLMAHITMGFMFGKSEENLTMRLRSLSFKALLRQATGSRIGLLTMTVFTLVSAAIIAFIHGWQLTLVVLACVPLLIGVNLIERRAIRGHASKDQKDLEEAGRISTEAVENIRTVVSLTKEDAFYEKYEASLRGPYRNALRKAFFHALTYAVAQSMSYFFNAAVFGFAAWLVAHCYMQPENVFVIVSVITCASSNVGNTNSTAQDYGQAKVSAQRIFKLLDRNPVIDSYSEEGNTLNEMKGNIEFKNIKFVYPTRPKAQVLQGLNIKVSKGQTLALVGSSGCGKSTVVQLLERFYDPVDGQVLADGIDTKSLHLKWLRSQLGIVSQEPILFDCSIGENIQYGDNSRLVTQEEVIAAAKLANIHTFIQSLPEGYNTRVGSHGAQLSGGQKQRIAIARALVRKPKVLLLDEATSALDTESEKVVQEALDEARHGRTCIVIAHRLSTIQNADIIVVMKNGKVVEQGTHNQLMAKEEEYYSLVHSHVSK